MRREKRKNFYGETDLIILEYPTIGYYFHSKLANVGLTDD